MPPTKAVFLLAPEGEGSVRIGGEHLLHVVLGNCVGPVDVRELDERGGRATQATGTAGHVGGRC